MNLSLTRPSHIPPDHRERALRDLETYRRELPCLLREDHAGQYAFIKDDQVLSIWETVGDALQAAGERFGLDPVATFTINPLDVERFARLSVPVRPGKEVVCPS